MEMSYTRLEEVLQDIEHLRRIDFDDDAIVAKRIRSWRARGFTELTGLVKSGLPLREIVAEILRRKARQQEKDALLSDPFGWRRENQKLTDL